MNGKKILIVFVCIVILITLILVFFVSNRKTGGGLFPVPTPVEGPGAGGPDAVPGLDPTIDKEGLEKQKQSAAVYALVEKTPYKGKFFTLYYSFSKDLFVLYINPSSKTNGDAEFEEFLKTNGVQKVWFKNLFVTYISPTPTPSKDVSPTPAP